MAQCVPLRATYCALRTPPPAPLRSLPHIRLALDLDLHARIDQPLHLDQRGDREIVAEIGDAARVDPRPLGDVGHEHLHLHDVLDPRARRLEAPVHHGDGAVELVDDVGRDAAVFRLADDARDPDVRTRAGDVAIVADRRTDIGNDDALDDRHGFPAWFTFDAWAHRNVQGAMSEARCALRWRSFRPREQSERGPESITPFASVPLGPPFNLTAGGYQFRARPNSASQTRVNALEGRPGMTERARL